MVGYTLTYHELTSEECISEHAGDHALTLYVSVFDISVSGNLTQ